MIHRDDIGFWTVGEQRAARLYLRGVISVAEADELLAYAWVAGI